MIEVETPADIPREPHFAVQVFSSQSVYHEGDERSRTHPGHGYPAYTEEIWQIKHYVTTDKSAWNQFIDYLFRQKPGRTDVVAFAVSAVPSLRTETRVVMD